MATGQVDGQTQVDDVDFAPEPEVVVPGARVHRSRTPRRP